MAAVPTPLRSLVLLLTAEGVALGLAGLAYAVTAATGSPENLLAAELEAGIAVLTGVVLGLLARAVARRRSWARTPALLLNLLAVPVAIGLLQAGVYAVGLPLLVVALVTSALLLAPPVARELRDPA